MLSDALAQTWAPPGRGSITRGEAAGTNVTALAPPTRPKRPVNDDVDSFLLERVTHGEGSRVSWAALYISYRARCDSNGCTPGDVRMFGARLDTHRAELGLKVRSKGKDAFFVDLKLAS